MLRRLVDLPLNMLRGISCDLPSLPVVVMMVHGLNEKLIRQVPIDIPVGSAIIISVIRQ